MLARLQHSRFQRQRGRHRANSLRAEGSPPLGGHRAGLRGRHSRGSALRTGPGSWPRLGMERELLLEIGTEELPASWLPDLTRQIRVGLESALKTHRLPPDAAL